MVREDSAVVRKDIEHNPVSRHTLGGVGGFEQDEARDESDD